MVPGRFLFLTSRERLMRIFSTLLLFGLLLLADGWLLVRAARSWGVYLSLAVEAGTAVGGLIIVGSTIQTRLRSIHRNAISGTFHAREHAVLATIVGAAAFLVLPGFASDIVGLLIYLPPGRQLCSYLILRFFGSSLEESYDYFKLELFSGGEDTNAHEDQEEQEIRR